MSFAHDMDDSYGDSDGAVASAPVWTVFGDLMTGLLGAFVLILASALAMQFDLAGQLESALKQREAEAQRRQTLEEALAQALRRVMPGPMAAGAVTLVDGRIGISGSLLFALNSAELQPEGREVLRGLAGPLATYLAQRQESLMVSGFTDDRPVRSAGRGFVDNLELSAQRALTVTRALIESGVPSSSVFAAAFGAERPVASNEDVAGRALNRRVEIAPMARRQGGADAELPPPMQTRPVAPEATAPAPAAASAMPSSTPSGTVEAR